MTSKSTIPGGFGGQDERRVEKNMIRYVLYRLKYASVYLGRSLTVKAATLIFISGRGSAISSAKQGNSGFIFNLVKS